MVPKTRLSRIRWITSASTPGPGRPPIDKEVAELIAGMAKENRSWGYNQIVGALANMGYRVSDQTVGNVLRRHDIAPAQERKRTTTWAEFIRTHLALLAGTDFFTVGVPHVARPDDPLCPFLHPSRESRG
jgi:putative transposase